MRISIKVVNGQEFTLVVSGSSEVREVKELIHTSMSIPVTDQKLLHRGRVLLDQKYLKDYNIQDGSRLTLMVKTSPVRSLDSPTQMSLPPVWEKLLTFLKRHFTEKDAELVLVEFRKSFELGLSRLSLEDIDRLAANKLQQLQQ